MFKVFRSDILHDVQSYQLQGSYCEEGEECPGEAEAGVEAVVSPSVTSVVVPVFETI